LEDKAGCEAQEVKEMNSSSNQVVQSHRRLRHIAPGSFFGELIGAERNSRGTATNPLAARGIATELDRCQTGVSCGLAAAHLRCRHMWWCRAKRAAQSEPDRRDAPRQSLLRLSAGNPTGPASSRRNSRPVRRKIQNLHHGDTEKFRSGDRA